MSFFHIAVCLQLKKMLLLTTLQYTCRETHPQRPTHKGTYHLPDLEAN